MSSPLIGTGAGFDINDPGFRGAGRLLLRALFGLPPSLRENLFFGSSRICLPLQKAVQRCLGGAAMVRARFTEGPLRGHVFECLSSEKYFMLGSSFEHPVQTVLRKTVRPGDIVYDIGAHAGYMALFLSTLCHPRGHVFAFEPSPLNFDRLKRNIELNQKHDITPVDLAASHIEGTVLLEQEGSESRIVLSKSKSAEKYLQIGAVRLDDFVYRDNHAPPTFVKIDVEGGAGRCLAGMSAILHNARPPLVCELHQIQEAAEVSSILAAHSYEIARVESPRKFPRCIIAIPR